MITVSHLRKLPAALIALFVTAGSLHAGPASSSPKGHWEGEITMMAGPLPIAADFSAAADKSWQGTIDMPGGVRAYKLSALKVDGTAIEFALPGMPGDPVYSGHFMADGATITGDFKQGDRSLPFKLVRKSLEPAAPPAPAAPGVPGKGLAGKWLGSIKPVPGVELRLGLEVLHTLPDNLEGTLISIDQGNGRIPTEEITVTPEGAVTFVAPSVKGNFSGKFNADGSELGGEWSQAGHPIALVFRRQKTP